MLHIGYVKENSTRSFLFDASEGVEMSLFVRDHENMRMSGCLPFSRVCSFCREDLRVVNMMEFISCAW